MSQIVDRFADAVELLVGEGPVKSRLMVAYSKYLEGLQQVDLPIPGKRELSELHAVMHKAEAVGKIDCVKASVQKMSAREACRYAHTIVRLYMELLAMEHGKRSQAEKPVKLADDRPPRFLVGGGP